LILPVFNSIDKIATPLKDSVTLVGGIPKKGPPASKEKTPREEILIDWMRMGSGREQQQQQQQQQQEHFI